MVHSFFLFFSFFLRPPRLSSRHRLPSPIRLVSVAGGSARPLGATARNRGRGSGTGRWGWPLPGLNSIPRARPGPEGSAQWYRPHYRLSLGPMSSSDVTACD
jgi:hypothetical protein